MAKNEADRFNTLHPVGTPVRYWTGVREGEGRVSRTRAPAAMICGHGSVWVEGCAGSIALSHVEVLLPNPMQSEKERMGDEEFGREFGAYERNYGHISRLFVEARRARERERELEAAGKIALEAIRDNLKAYQYKNEPLLREGFQALEKALSPP